jgi:hypothetical protein
VRERQCRRLAVGALHDADGGTERDQRVEDFWRAIEVRLERDADVAEFGAEGAIEIDGAIEIGGALHVDPEHVAGVGGVSREAYEVTAAEFRSEVEAELGGLDRYPGVQTGLADPVEKVEVVGDHRVRFGGIADVLAEMGEDRRHAGGREVTCGTERVIDVFAWHEAGDGAADEGAARGLFAQPAALGSCEEE